IDVLQQLQEKASVQVTISIPFHDRKLCRMIEPNAPPPQVRYETIARLHEAGIPVGVNVAPLIPGLNDNQVPEILKNAHQAGAQWADTILVRLPGSVAPYFEKQLREALPNRAEAVLARIRRARGGALNDSRFGTRMRGNGPEWESTRQLFQITRNKLGIDSRPPSSARTFRRPGGGRQVSLFQSS
ncbi:MAG: radical SAM protein, partial [Myxococcota bacterium]|nr:radical SAM protein [Myxococcota bacterium]